MYLHSYYIIGIANGMINFVVLFGSISCLNITKFSIEKEISLTHVSFVAFHLKKISKHALKIAIHTILL